MLDALTRHWPEYLMEAAGLGIYMISVAAFGTILEYPGSPIPQAMTDPMWRRVLMGLAMGATAMGVIYSPWGKQSGAHFNPAVTLSFFRLRKIEPWDAAFYVIAQFGGGLTGVLLVAAAVRVAIGDPAVNYVVTVPGLRGPTAAFLAELVISFVLVGVILIVTNTKNLARYTGMFAGVLLATYMMIESPLSGMSANPARTFGSALPAQLFTGLWIYFTAPPLGMLLASEIYVRVRGAHRVMCAKLHHQNDKRCIFRCGYREQGVQP